MPTGCPRNASNRRTRDRRRPAHRRRRPGLHGPVRHRPRCRLDAAARRRRRRPLRRAAPGEPTAQDWAEATGTISYEIVTRVGARVPRLLLGGTRGRTDEPATQPASSGSPPAWREWPRRVARRRGRRPGRQAPVRRWPPSRRRSCSRSPPTRSTSCSPTTGSRCTPRSTCPTRRRARGGRGHDVAGPRREPAHHRVHPRLLPQPALLGTTSGGRSRRPGTGVVSSGTSAATAAPAAATPRATIIDQVGGRPRRRHRRSSRPKGPSCSSGTRWAA